MLFSSDIQYAPISIHAAIILFIDTSAIFALSLHYNTAIHYFMTMCMYSALRLKIQILRGHGTIVSSCIASSVNYNRAVVHGWLLYKMLVNVILGYYMLVQNIPERHLDIHEFRVISSRNCATDFDFTWKLLESAFLQAPNDLVEIVLDVIVHITLGFSSVSHDGEIILLETSSKCCVPLLVIVEILS